MEEYRGWFKEQESVITDESRRPGKPKTYDDLFGLEGSFRQLVIDWATTDGRRETQSYTQEIIYIKTTGLYKQTDKLTEEIKLTPLPTYLPVT
jgi:hypothetical protein